MADWGPGRSKMDDPGFLARSIQLWILLAPVLPEDQIPPLLSRFPAQYPMCFALKLPHVHSLCCMGCFMLDRRDEEGRLLLSNLMYPFSKPYLLASHMHVERYRVGFFSAVHCFKTWRRYKYSSFHIKVLDKTIWSYQNCNMYMTLINMFNRWIWSLSKFTILFGIFIL